MAGDCNIQAEGERSRRNFLKLSLTGAGLSLSGGCTSLSRLSPFRRRKIPPAPSSQPLRMAFIGVGGIGKRHLDILSKSRVQIAALCDVDGRELHGARDMLAIKFPNVQIFQDFRVMFDNVRNLDAVIIATPDHGHGMQAVRALREGCHVYLETPAVHTLDELTVLEREARKVKRLVLSGDLRTSHEMALRGCEALRTGVTGKILQVHIWTNRPVWPQGVELPAGSDPVPNTLAWDLWLAGVAPRPFKRFSYHKFNWRGWTDFGSGALGDIGCQLLSFPCKVLELGVPESVERLHASGSSTASYPKSSELKFICKSKVQKNRVELFWYDGGHMPSAGILQQAQATLGRIPGTGILLTGERGSWLVSGSECRQHYLGLNGSPRMTDFEKHDLWTSAPRFLPRIVSPQQHFLRAVRSGKGYDFNLTAETALNKAVLIGAVVQRVGGLLEWNDRKGRFNNNDAANKMLAPDLQPGWEYLQ